MSALGKGHFKKLAAFVSNYGMGASVFTSLLKNYSNEAAASVVAGLDTFSKAVDSASSSLDGLVQSFGSAKEWPHSAVVQLVQHLDAVFGRGTVVSAFLLPLELLYEITFWSGDVVKVTTELLQHPEHAAFVSKMVISIRQKLGVHVSEIPPHSSLVQANPDAWGTFEKKLREEAGVLLGVIVFRREEAIANRWLCVVRHACPKAEPCLILLERLLAYPLDACSYAIDHLRLA